VTATPEQAAAPPVTQKREFWVLMGCALVLGVFGAFAGLIFVGVINFGGKWYSDSHPGWFGGYWWWVAITAAAGVAVGLVRRLTRLPWETPGLFDDLQTGHVDRGSGGCAVLDGAVGWIPDPGRGTADRTHPHRRRHRLPRHGRREIPPGQSQKGPRSRETSGRGETSRPGETNNSGLRMTGTPTSSKDSEEFNKGDQHGVGYRWSYPLLCTHRHSWRYDAQEGPLGHICHWHLLAILLAYRRDHAFAEGRL
jgi:hypothetical protein